MPKFLGLKLLLGILGIPGLPSASYVGYMMWDAANPTMERYLQNQGKNWSPVSANVSESIAGETLTVPTESEEITNLFEQGTSPCFKKFFGDTSNSNKILYDLKSSQTPNDGVLEPDLTVPSNTSSSKAEGCAYINFSYWQKEIGNSESHWLFRAVLTARKDDVGLALFARWNLGDHSSSDKQISLVYSLLFMEKASDKWSVKGGYSWVDNKLKDQSTTTITPDYTNYSTGYAVTAKTYIKVPEPQPWSSENTQLSTNLSKHYAGLWIESSEEGTEEFFKSIKVQKDSSTHGEILGLKDYEFAESDAGYTKVSLTRLNGSWRKIIDWGGIQNYNIKSRLKEWFSQFKDKRGKWTTFDDYCEQFKKLHKTRAFDPNSQDMQSMLKWCFH